eukprot:UN04970
MQLFYLFYAKIMLTLKLMHMIYNSSNHQFLRKYVLFACYFLFGSSKLFSSGIWIE